MRIAWLALVFFSVWGRSAAAGDYWIIIAGPDCPRKEMMTKTPRPSFIPVRDVVTSLRSEFGTTKPLGPSNWASALANGHDTFCSLNDQHAVWEALLVAIVQPAFFHQRSYLEVVQVLGNRWLLDRFEALLAHPDLPPFARPRVTAARDVLRRKYPKAPPSSASRR